MADSGFVSGFICVSIDMAINQILHHINFALYCKKELASLGDVVMEIKPILTHIQQYRLELNINEGISTHNASAVNGWFRKLDSLLREAFLIAQDCTKPTYNVISRYITSRRIIRSISEIGTHLKVIPLTIFDQTQLLLGSENPILGGSTSYSATTSLQAGAPTAGFFMEEPLIVGQEEVFAKLEKFVMSAAEGKSPIRIGVLGKGGSGKTLLLKRVFNSQKVRDHFSEELLLWLTVSQRHFTRLRNELYKQIVMQTQEDMVNNMNEEDVKMLLVDRLQSRKFALFLDDVSGEGAKLLEELGLVMGLNYTVVVSSRNHRALTEMGIANEFRLMIEDLMEEESWRLFANHAFPDNNGRLPANIDEETAKNVCANCGGLPLAIKVLGKAMADITHPEGWKMAVRTLPNADSQDNQALYDRLRFSYDLLGNYNNNLQLCFLYLAAAFIEDQIVFPEFELIQWWIGEGLLARKQQQQQVDESIGYDPVEIGRVYVEHLANRCLIEPIMRDIDGRVVCFSMHDVLRDLGICIAEQEENFYCRVGRALTVVNENECGGRTRILLNQNKLSSLPGSLRDPELCSLLLAENLDLTQIPKRVIGSMISLKVLDLSRTSLQSLPESVGCLKQLVCLRLEGLPITRLPASLTNIVSLEILSLGGAAITELPFNLHDLRSLRYLGLNKCKDLQYLPGSISRLKSLQYLPMDECSNLWWRKNRLKTRAASINDLGSLTELKMLVLENHGETLCEGTLGRLAEMEILNLKLTMMVSLPRDMANMSKLKRLRLEVTDLVKFENRNFCQNLSYLALYRCISLEQISNLQELSSLKQLHIVQCPKLKMFPKEFGEKGAFIQLEIFSLVKLDGLEELPIREEGAIPSLKIFNMMECGALKMFPESYLEIKGLRKLRVYGCSPMISEDLKNIKMPNQKLKVITLSLRDIQQFEKQYLRSSDQQIEEWVSGEFECNEIYSFFRSLSYVQ